MKLKTTAVLAGLLWGLMMPLVSFAGVSVTSGLTYEKTAAAGETYQGIIQLRNPGDTPQEVKVYQTDYLFFSDGTNIYGDPGTDPRSNADWITFSPQRFFIPPKGSSQVNYTVKVPENETLAGTFWSMMMIEAVSSESPEAVKKDKDKITFGISQVIRYGAQMVTHIGDTGVSTIKFLNTSVLKEKQERILQLDLENTGERLLRASLWVDLYDQSGGSVGRFEGGKRGIYPTTSVRFRIDLSRVPPGEYKALVVADCGDDDLFGATYNLKFE